MNMKTLLLIFQIGQVLWSVAPELYEAFKKIIAMFPQTPEMVVQATKTTGKDLLPDVGSETAAELQQAVTAYEKAAAEYALTIDTP